jgi:PAP2 superfamily
VTTIAACPPLDDWSFPSNHSVIAAGAAATLVLAWRGLAWVVFPLAAVMAFSRVFVGVHYPHDVAVGFLLGATLAPLLALLVVGAVTPAVRLVRTRLTGGTPAAQPGLSAVTASYGAEPQQPFGGAQQEQPFGGAQPEQHFGGAQSERAPYAPGPYAGGEAPQRSVVSMSRSRMPGSE